MVQLTERAFDVLKEAQAVVELLEQLRQDEGAVVMLGCTNPDYNGQPNEAVDVIAEFTAWQCHRFTGATLVEAMSAAADAKAAFDRARRPTSGDEQLWETDGTDLLDSPS